MKPEHDNDSLPATNEAGHRWTGETEIESGVTWYHYVDFAGNEYQSKEQPAFRIVLNNACQMNGALVPLPLCPSSALPDWDETI